MNIPNLTKLGSCSSCKQLLTLFPKTSWIPEHTQPGSSTICSGSHYSPDRVEYLIQTDEEARQVAEFFKNDGATHCLDSYGLHSMACGNGRRCAEIRGLLAKAFAKYYLKQNPVPVQT